MATAEFNEKIEALVNGLLADSQSDVAYDYVLPLHEALVAAQQDYDTEYLQMQFIRLIRESPQLRNHIINRNTSQALPILLKAFPHHLAPALKEIALGLDVPELFRADSEKKMWKRIKKLVMCSGLGNFVYAPEANDADTQQPSSRSKGAEQSEIKVARTNRFNHGYRAFLAQLETAFPVLGGGEDDGGDTCVEAFDAAVEDDPEAILQTFKHHVLPIVPKIAEKVQEQKTAAGVKSALEPYFGSDTAWFKGLPLVNSLPIDTYWETQIINNDANKQVIMKALGELALTMTGIDTLIYSPIVSALRDKAKEIMLREKITPQSLVPTTGSFNKSSAMNLVLELVQELPAATGGKISSSDMETLITNLMAGRDEVPPAFNEVFSPDMIDADCIEAVSEMPGIGDALAPFMASMQGEMTGSTGMSAFGAAVEAPAWLSREAPRRDDSSSD